MALLSRALRTYRHHGARELLSRVRAYGTMKAFPNLPYPLVTLRWYFAVRDQLGLNRFGPHDPFELRVVDPTEITRISGNARGAGADRRLYWGTVEPGDWDRHTEHFRDLPVPRSIFLHYREGVPWEKTPLRECFDRSVEIPAGGWGHSDPTDLPDRVAEIERLREAIEEGGYKSKRTLATEGSIDSNEQIPPILDEVTIDVGRDGSLLYRDFGQHRLAIAQLLELDSIPVLVATRHPEHTAVE